MKRMVCNVLLPGVMVGLIIMFCYPVCMKDDGFDFFLFWILTGFLFGVRKMNLVFMPKNLGIGGGIGVLALNCMIGGMIGGFVLCIKIITILMELTLIILETFGQKVLK